MANSPLYSRSEILNSYVSVRRGSIAEIELLYYYIILLYYSIILYYYIILYCIIILYYYIYYIIYILYIYYSGYYIILHTEPRTTVSYHTSSVS